MTTTQRVKATFKAEPFFRRIIYVLVAGGVGIASIEPMIDWEKFEFSWTFILPLLWAAFRAGAGYWRAEFSNRPNSGVARLLALTVVAGIAFGAAGCASTSQTVTTMDGDTFHHKGFALLSKQDIKQDAFMEVLPNNSGMTVEIGTQAQQDAEALVPIVSAIVQAVISSGLGGHTPLSPQTSSDPQGQSVISRLNEALEGIRELRQQIDILRGE
jgi:hypothetical protein